MATAEELYGQALKERVSSADPYKGADGNTYQTTRFKDNTLGTINTSTGNLVGGYYSDAERAGMRQSIEGGAIGNTQEAPNLYAMTQEQLQSKVGQVGQAYTNAIANFNTSNIAEGIRLRSGGTKDLDANIENLKMSLNKARPELMAKYASIKDPAKREQLINAEEKRIAGDINNLEAIRTYRIGTIQDMINGEIENKKQTINGLQAQYNLYASVLGDKKEAEKTKREIEKQAIEMEKARVELDYYKSQLPNMQKENEIKMRTAELGLATAEERAGYTYSGTDARTNRHMNPTAFTTDIAKQGGLVEGVDYEAGDSFGDKGQYKTAKLLGDPIQLTKEVIDNIGFTTQSGANRWTYTNNIKIDGKVLNNANWKTFTDEQKTRAIQEMYKNETVGDKRNFDIFTGKATPSTTGYTKTGTPTAKDIPTLAKNIKTPEDFKTAIGNVADIKKLYDSITPKQALDILKQDKGYTLVGNNELLSKASQIDANAVNGYKYQKLTNDFAKADDTTIITLVKQLQGKKISNEVIKDIIEKAGILKRDYFKSGLFNDKEGYDKLQELGIL